MNEAFRIVCPGVLQSALALFEDLLDAAVMDVAGGEHGDTGVAMLAVVPREEGPAERDRGVDFFEATRKAGVVFQGFELGFGEWVFIADLGPSE